MIKVSNRDLLVVAREMLDDDSLQHEIALLNEILPIVELENKVAGTMEVFDLIRCRHLKQPGAVKKRLRDKTPGSFVFICNKN